MSGCEGNESDPVAVEKEDPTSGTISVDGFELAYFIEGTGIPCVFINEALAGSRSLSPELRKHFKFIFLDGRHNVLPDPAYDVSSLTLDVLVEDVERVRKELGYEKIAVMGSSIWGVVALEYGRKYPEFTSHIIMHATPPGLFGGLNEYMKITGDYFASHASDERKAAHQENLEARADRVASAPSGRAAIENYIMNSALYWFDPNFDPTWIFEDVIWNDEVDTQVFVNIMAEYDILKGEPLQIPLFLALGKYDFAVPAFLWDEYKDKISNLTIEYFEKSGHWAFYEEQTQFNSALIEWAKQN
jgi:proline iminopeptidase